MEQRRFGSTKRNVAVIGHGATLRQVALRFLVRLPSLFAIPKASSPEHAAENAGAGDLRLSEAELARIDQAFPRGARPRELAML
jgi:diketogulonate reductase-like aldo/keto reductase